MRLKNTIMIILNTKKHKEELERLKKENDGLRKAVIRLMEENANLKAGKGTLKEKIYFKMGED